MWGYPFWTFAPLAVLMVWPPSLEAAQLRRFAGVALAVLIAFPVAFAAVELGEPFFRDRSKGNAVFRAASSPRPSPGNGGKRPERPSPMSAAPL